MSSSNSDSDHGSPLYSAGGSNWSLSTGSSRDFLCLPDSGGSLRRSNRPPDSHIPKGLEASSNAHKLPAYLGYILDVNLYSVGLPHSIEFLSDSECSFVVYISENSLAQSLPIVYAFYRRQLSTVQP